MTDNKVAANGSAASESYSWQLITSNKSDEEQQNSAIKQLVIKIADSVAAALCVVMFM